MGWSSKSDFEPILGSSWGHLGPSRAHLGPSWALLGPILAASGAMLGYLVTLGVFLVLYLVVLG